MNSWLIIILLGFIIHVYYFVNYKTIKEKNFDVIEYSCKFSNDSTFNDSRYIRMFYNNIEESEKIIFDKYIRNTDLTDFYYSIKNIIGVKNIKGIVIGFDKQKSVEKIYIDTDRIIIGKEVNLQNKKTNFRKYIAKKFNKESLNNFIGKDKSDIICKFLNFHTNDLKPDMVFNKHIGNSVDSIDMKNIVSKHISFLNLSKKIYISDFKEEITKIINLFKCNSDGLDEWLEKNKNKQIAWIGLTKVKDNNIDVTIYYRK